MNVSKFDLDNEIQAVLDYVSSTWEGVAQEQLKMIVNESFKAGWSDFRHKHQNSFSASLAARTKVLSELDLPTEVIQNDLLARALMQATIGSLDMQAERLDVEKKIKTIVNDLRSSSGASVSAVRRKNTDDDTFVFTGTDTGDRAARSFVSATGVHQVAYDTQGQNRSALTTLAGAIYAQGAGLREQLNTATLIRDMTTIDVTARVCLEPEALQLPDNPHLREALLRDQVTLSEELIARFSWVPTASPIDVHP
jgi:hypothetical protein